MQKLIVLAPQTSTGDNRLDREQKNNPSSFSRRRHQTSNSTQKHRRQRQPCNSINEEPTSSSAIFRTTSSLGLMICIDPRSQNPRSDPPQEEITVAMAISNDGQPMKSPSPWNGWALYWHSDPRECLDLWWNWLVERGQRQSATGVLGLDRKQSGITISARAS